VDGPGRNGPRLGATGVREVEKRAGSVEEAVGAALADLGISEDAAIVEVVQEPKGGFLGVGGHEAVVRVRAKPDAPAPMDLEEQADAAADFVEELDTREGELIGFSTQSANCMFTLEIVRQLRERGSRKTIVLGGPSVRLQTPGDPRSVGLTGFKPEDLDESAARRKGFLYEGIGRS